MPITVTASSGTRNRNWPDAAGLRTRDTLIDAPLFAISGDSANSATLATWKLVVPSEAGNAILIPEHDYAP